MNPDDKNVGLRSLPRLPEWVARWNVEYTDGKAMGRLTHDQTYELIQYALQANKALEEIRGFVASEIGRIGNYEI